MKWIKKLITKIKNIDPKEKQIAFMAALLAISIPGVFLLGVRSCEEIDGWGDVYETNSVQDYGYITGTFSDKEAEKDILAFFPQKIDDRFENVQYHYAAMKGPECAFECYLEFTVEDPQEFAQLVEQHTKPEDTKTFVYDKSFQEYTKYDDYWLVVSDESYFINSAYVWKVLYREEDHRMIFAALKVRGSGWVSPDNFSHFLNRFEIDPVEYARNTPKRQAD